MKAIGLGGVQVFEANLMTPQIVAKRIDCMSPTWRRAFRLAANRSTGRLPRRQALPDRSGRSRSQTSWLRWDSSVATKALLILAKGATMPMQSARNGRYRDRGGNSCQT